MSQNTVKAIMSVFELSVKHKMWAARDKPHIEISVSVCLQLSPSAEELNFIICRALRDGKKYVSK